MMITFDPKVENLEEVKLWLKEECESEGSSFICNWEVIESCFHSKRMSCAIVDGAAVGFLCWSEVGRLTELSIAAIRPAVRRHGIGGILANATTEYLAQTHEVLIVRLECNPPASESFWRKVGFTNLPIGFEQSSANVSTTLFRILVPHLTPAASGDARETIKLWTYEPWEVSEAVTPAWTWNVDPERGKNPFPKPIVQLCRGDWCFEWKRGNETLCRGKAKHVLKAYCTSSKVLYLEGLEITDLKNADNEQST
jgi:GNAT superfamily N-acetyltransferase